MWFIVRKKKKKIVTGKLVCVNIISPDPKPFYIRFIKNAGSFKNIKCIWARLYESIHTSTYTTLYRRSRYLWNFTMLSTCEPLSIISSSYWLEHKKKVTIQRKRKYCKVLWKLTQLL